ncbi:MAG: rhodanese-like domain-containing protein, partial [Bacillota bacterium]
ISLNDLAKTDILKLLPKSKKLIIVGYDGMDASFGVRALVTMGYNAVALKYGLSFWNDELVPSTSPLHPELIPEYFELTPLNYLPPSTGPAGCG